MKVTRLIGSFACILALALAWAGTAAAAPEVSVEQGKVQTNTGKKLKMGDTVKASKVKLKGSGAKVQVSRDKTSAKITYPDGTSLSAGCGCTASTGPNQGRCYYSSDKNECFPEPHGSCDACTDMEVRVTGVGGPASTSTTTGN